MPFDEEGVTTIGDLINVHDNENVDRIYLTIDSKVVIRLGSEGGREYAIARFVIGRSLRDEG